MYYTHQLRECMRIGYSLNFVLGFYWGTFGDRLGGIENRFGTVKG